MIGQVISHVVMYFFFSILNNWQTGNRFKERNQVITFFSISYYIFLTLKVKVKVYWEILQSIKEYQERDNNTSPQNT